MGAPFVCFPEIKMPGIYLEPAGFLYGAVAKEAIALGGALPLAGSSIAFSAVRLWEGEFGKIRHAMVRIATIQEIGDARVKEVLDRMVAPRTGIAGVSMDRPRIMGIVNVTPDSFSDGGDNIETDAALKHAEALASEGADFIDIGAESTRPGSRPTPVEEELRRLMPVLEGLASFTVPISVDTRKPDVMREAVKAGAALINDVSAFTFSHDSLRTVAKLQKPAVVMHARGDPETMQDNPVYKDAVIEVYDFLESRIEAAVAAGLSRECVIADPGIGFGKTLAHNLSILRCMGLFHGLGVPLLTGASRKGFIGRITGVQSPKDREAGSVAVALDAVSQGVQIVRAHDVQATRQALSVWEALRGSPNIAIQNS
jgi:dihydropteroate synthase